MLTFLTFRKLTILSYETSFTQPFFQTSFIAYDFFLFPYLLTFQIHDLSLRILALIQFVLLLLTYIYYRFTYSVLNQWHWFVSVQLKKKRFVLNSFSYSFHNMEIKQWKVKKIKQKKTLLRISVKSILVQVAS